MNFMSKSTEKYISITLAVFLALAFFGSSGNVVHAQIFALPTTISPTGTISSNLTSSNAPTATPSPWSCLTDGVTCAVTYLTSWVSTLFTFFITIGAWLIDFGLSLTNQVYNMNAVQNGFGVMLSLANLGFVLAIIIIAVATILQREAYGYKKVLWRLVAMAILVNFGLVITAPIIGFANGMTSYFEHSIQGGTSGISAFTSQIATKLNVGAGQIAPTINQQSSAPDRFTQSLLSLVFLIVFKFVVALAFFLIGALLFVRFIWLAVLLILLPLAWLTWIFPNFSHQFSKWWQKFIHWTFFAPAAMFFIWLATNISKAYTSSLQNGNTAGGALVATTGLPGTVSQFANNLVVVGIMIGGLLAASKLAEGAGAFAVTQGKAVSNAVTGYVGKKTKKGARMVYQKAKGPEMANSMREGRIFGLNVNRIPLVRRAVSAAGRNLATVSTNSKMVDEAAKKTPKGWEDIKKDLASGGLTNEQKFAWIAEAVKQGKLTEKTKIGAQDASEFFDKNAALFERYGQGKLRGDADKLFMGNQKYREARAAGDAATMQAEMNTFLNEKMEKKDSSKVNSNEIFKPGADRADIDARISGLALQRPEFVPGIYQKLNGNNQRYFEQVYGAFLNTKIEGHEQRIKAARGDLDTQVQTLQQKTESLRRSRTLAVGRDQESIDRDILANEESMKKLQDQIAAANDKIDPAQLAEYNRLKKAKTAFDRMIINNASEAPPEEKHEDKKDEHGGAGGGRRGGGGSNSGGGGGAGGGGGHTPPPTGDGGHGH